MNKEIVLSTGKKCPKCGCDSLEECYSKKTVIYDKHYRCVLECGMQFALDREGKGKIRLYYKDEKNEPYLKKRFKF